MEKEKIIKGNELIAGFDSLITKINRTTFNLQYARTGGSYYKEGLHYHDSWDWLMPVIAQINKMHDDSPYKLWDNIEFGLCDQNIDMTWQAVVKYCEWHKITQK